MANEPDYDFQFTIDPDETEPVVLTLPEAPQSYRVQHVGGSAYGHTGYSSAAYPQNVTFNDGGKEIARVEHDDHMPTRILLDEEACRETIVESMRDPADVTIERKHGGYTVKKTVRRWVPQDVELEEEFEMGPSGGFTEFSAWAMTLNPEELDAAVQVYYDIWNFEDGGFEARMRYTILSELKDGKK